MSALHQIALTFLKNVGPATAKTMISHFGSAERIFTVPKSKLREIPGITESRLNTLGLEEALKKADAEMKHVERNGVDVLFYTDPRFPKRLKNCNDSPLLLFSKGNADLNSKRIVSIVGTRNITDYGRKLCHQLVEELQHYNVLVVSGLAFGVDLAAHRECLSFNMPTVGVLGHGLGMVYPPSNIQTADKMLENGGLLSEYYYEVKPERVHFPERNRIVAGMADATVVIEASIKGGALITAEIANSYNRDVFTFPGRIDDEFSEGCNFLVRNNKAALLTNPADLPYSMGWERVDQEKPVAVDQLALPIDLTGEEQSIFSTIKQYNSPIAIDDLAIKINMPMSQLVMNLLNMEMQGYIRSLPGKTYAVN